MYPQIYPQQIKTAFFTLRPWKVLQVSLSPIAARNFRCLSAQISLEHRSAFRSVGSFKLRRSWSLSSRHLRML